MGSLSGNQIKNTYSSLLKLETNGASSSLKTVEDGAGVDTALAISTNKVQVEALKFNTTPATDNTEATAILVNATDDVVKRELGTNAFNSDAILRPTYILRQNTSQALAGSFQPMDFATVSNTSPTGSYRIGDVVTNFTLSVNELTVLTAGVYRIDVSLQFENAANANIETQIRVNSTAIATAKRSKGGAITDSMTSFYYTKYLSSNDIIDIVNLVSSGGAELAAGSAVEIVKLT